jgi:hypothetical protein
MARGNGAPAAAYRGCGAGRLSRSADRARCSTDLTAGTEMPIAAATSGRGAQPVPARPRAAGEGGSKMTGSSLAPVLVPIVVVISLAIWLIMVFRADSHPGYRHHAPAVRGQNPRQAMRSVGRPQVPRQRARPLDKAVVVGRVPDLGARPGTGAGRRVPAGQAGR